MGEKEHQLRATLGYDGATIPREWSICTLTYLDENAKSFVVPNTLEHPLTRDHLIVNNPPYIRSYAAANIFVDGVKVGTLCVCDPAPREFSQRDIALLVDMAACVSEMLASRNKRWIQDHVSGISLSSTILSSIKPPLERVGEDMQSIHDTVVHMDISEPPSSPVRTQADAEELTGCDSHSQTLTYDDFLPQLWGRSGPRSDSFRHFETSADDGVDPYEKLEGAVEHLRDDVVRLGKAIDLSIHQMMELSLRGRNGQLSLPFSMPSSRKSSPRSSSVSFSMERSDDTSAALSFAGLPLSPLREKLGSTDSSVESPSRSNPDVPDTDVRIVRRGSTRDQMLDLWMGVQDQATSGTAASDRYETGNCHRSQRPPRPPNAAVSSNTQRSHEEDSLTAPLCVLSETPR